MQGLPVSSKLKKWAPWDRVGQSGKRKAESGKVKNVSALGFPLLAIVLLGENIPICLWDSQRTIHLAPAGKSDSACRTFLLWRICCPVVVTAVSIRTIQATAIIRHLPAGKKVPAI
jgi:hypothetical protein